MVSPPSTPKPRRALTKAVLPALALAAGAVALVLLAVTLPLMRPADPPQGCVTHPPETLGGPIDLIDGQGRAITQAAFAGRPALVYFGFTNCPDVCPTTMYLLEQALARLSSDGASYQSALITVDPERDGPAQMAAYAQTDGFPHGLQGLTGSLAQVQAAEDRFGVTAIKAPLEGGGYNVNHTSFLYILDGAWRLKGIMRTVQTTPEEVAACVKLSLQGA